MKHDLKAYRKNYPKTCYQCGGPLDGPPEDDKELLEMLEEHDGLFPGKPLDTACVICDPCFQKYVPGGKKISFN